MTIEKHINAIKSIYQDTSTEHDLQIKRVIEQIQEEVLDDAGIKDGINYVLIHRETEEREEAEA